MFKLKGDFFGGVLESECFLEIFLLVGLLVLLGWIGFGGVFISVWVLGLVGCLGFVLFSLVCVYLRCPLNDIVFGICFVFVSLRVFALPFEWYCGCLDVVVGVLFLSASISCILPPARCFPAILAPLPGTTIGFNTGSNKSRPKPSVSSPGSQVRGNNEPGGPEPHTALDRTPWFQQIFFGEGNVGAQMLGVRFGMLSWLFNRCDIGFH